MLNVILFLFVIVNLNSVKLDVFFLILFIMMIIYGIVVKIIVIWFFRKYDNYMCGFVGMMIGFMNIGLFVYLLVEVIWLFKGMIYFGMVDIGGVIIMFGIIYFVGSYFSEGSD